MAVSIKDLNVDECAKFYLTQTIENDRDPLHEKNMFKVLEKHTNFTKHKAVPILEMLYENKVKDNKLLKILWIDFIGNNYNRKIFKNTLQNAIEQNKKIVSMVKVQSSKDELELQLNELKKEMSLLKNTNDKYKAHIQTLKKEKEIIEKQSSTFENQCKLLNEKVKFSEKMYAEKEENNALLKMLLDTMKQKKI